jgi:PAS domain S-box-containing protein
MIVRAADEATLFKEACRIAVSVGQFRMAWIGLIDEHTKKVVPVMQAGEGLDYLSKIKTISIADVPEGRGPTGTAIREGRYIVCNDIENDPQMAPWQEAALGHGYHSSIALPIFKRGKVIGAFGLYAPVKNFFDGPEITLLAEVTRDISFALDIFDKDNLRKKAEEAVLESERRYHTLADISPVGIFHTDATGYTTYVNPRWCRISGMSFEKAMGNGWLDAVHPDDKDALFRGWEEATKTQQLSLSEYRFMRPDGSISWVLGQAVPEKDAEDRIIGYVGTIQDITERKKIEHEILKEKNLSDSIINSMPGAFYLYTREGKFLRWNKNFEKVTGYSAEEISGMRPLDFFDKDEKEQIGRKIEEVFEKGEESIEANCHLKTGEKVPFYFTGKAIAYGGKQCLVGVGIDISKRVEAQEKIRQTSEQLRQLAAHLQDVREEERASMAREIHDELGQQLTGLKMDVYWLKEELTGAGEGIKQQVDSVLNLLDETIGTVRKISGALRPSVLDDLGLVEALRVHGREFQKRFGIEVDFSTDLEDVPIPAKLAISLFRIFQESLTNVARHADATKVSSQMTRSGHNIVLKIADNGRGFNIADTALKKTLGLLGMKERILMLDGVYEINSQPGNGTEIVVTVPLQPFVA